MEQLQLYLHILHVYIYHQAKYLSGSLWVLEVLVFQNIGFSIVYCKIGILDRYLNINIAQPFYTVGNKLRVISESTDPQLFKNAPDSHPIWCRC